MKHHSVMFQRGGRSAIESVPPYRFRHLTLENSPADCFQKNIFYFSKRGTGYFITAAVPLLGTPSIAGRSSFSAYAEKFTFAELLNVRLRAQAGVSPSADGDHRAPRPLETSPTRLRWTSCCRRQSRLSCL